MTDADMAESIHHPLVGEDTAGGDEVFDNSRIDWPTRSGLSGHRLARAGHSKRADDHADNHYLPPLNQLSTATPSIFKHRLQLKNDTQVYMQFAEEAVLADGALPISR
jgi:hypothetical protein